MRKAFSFQKLPNISIFASTFYKYVII